MPILRCTLLILAILGVQELPAPAPSKHDLLKLLDPAKDGVEGLWTRDKDALRSPATFFARIEVPYEPPDEYDLLLSVERLGGNSFNLGLARGDVQFMVVFDGAMQAGPTSGLDLIEGQPFHANETSTRERCFTDRKAARILCSVRNAKLQVTVDGKTLIDWKADYERLTLYPDWRVRRKRTLFLGSWAQVRILSAELTEVSGTGRKLR